MRTAVLLGTATGVGLGIAFLDSRPAWDHSGITALVLLLTAGVLGYLGPRTPWLWALAVGLWIPLRTFIQNPSPATYAMLFVLAFPLVGAYAGAAVWYVLHRPAARRH